MNYLTFKKGETVIVYDGGKSRNSIELAQIGADSSYVSDEVLVTYGAFNIRQSKSAVHKLPASLKKAIKAANTKGG